MPLSVVGEAVDAGLPAGVPLSLAPPGVTPPVALEAGAEDAEAITASAQTNRVAQDYTLS